MTITTQFNIGDKVLHLGKPGWTVVAITASAASDDGGAISTWVWYAIRHNEQRTRANVRESALEHEEVRAGA